MEWFVFFLNWYAENPCLGIPILLTVLVALVLIGDIISLPIRGIFKIPEEKFTITMEEEEE